jgi:hypothetical protein
VAAPLATALLAGTAAFWGNLRELMQ